MDSLSHVSCATRSVVMISATGAFMEIVSTGKTLMVSSSTVFTTTGMGGISFMVCVSVH